MIPCLKKQPVINLWMQVGSVLAPKILMNQLYLPFLSTSPRAKATNTRLEHSNTPKYALAATWSGLITSYFPERQDLHKYSIAWSTRRQKRTLATCNIKHLRVRVAKELNNPEHWHILEALIYHEMCHAVLGFSIKNAGSKTAWHGREFKLLEARHPGIPALNSWIKEGGWRRAVRQDRSRYPNKKIESNRKLFTKFIKQHLSRIFIGSARAK
jgi:predicted SprT family Zn-dependent metalloprotease